MLKDADEKGLVSIEIPPISGDVGMERLWDPDIQLAINDKQTQERVIKTRRWLQWHII